MAACDSFRDSLAYSELFSPEQPLDKSDLMHAQSLEPCGRYMAAIEWPCRQHRVKVWAASNGKAIGAVCGDGRRCGRHQNEGEAHPQLKLGGRGTRQEKAEPQLRGLSPSGRRDKPSQTPPSLLGTRLFSFDLFVQSIRTHTSMVEDE